MPERTITATVAVIVASLAIASGSNATVGTIISIVAVAALAIGGIGTVAYLCRLNSDDHITWHRIERATPANRHDDRLKETTRFMQNVV